MGEPQKARQGDRAAVWAWEQPEQQQQLLQLRGAVQHDGFRELPDLRQCQIFTNLANQINAVGRFVESQEYWNRALAIKPRFGMALGNRGYGLAEYARALYDQGHKRVFLWQAHKSLSAALSDEAEYEGEGYSGANAFFANIRDQIAARIDVEEVERAMDLDGYEIGASEEERAYRLWCLDNTLFLYLLNDLGPHRIAARDILHLPPFVTPIYQPPALLGLFNQLKQEFVTARAELRRHAKRGRAFRRPQRVALQYARLSNLFDRHRKSKSGVPACVLALRQDRLLPQRLSGSEA